MKRLGMLLALGATVLSLNSNPELKVSFLDTGKSDSILLQVEDKAILIDAGTRDRGSAIVDYLRYSGVDHLDAFVVTHAHDDHYGGADAVLSSVSVDKIYSSDFDSLGDYVKEAIESSGVETIVPDEGSIIFDSDGLKLTVLSNGSKFLGSHKAAALNNQSIVIRADYGERSFLFTGDILDSAQQYLTESPYADLLDCDVLKAPHHASTNSISQEFLDKVSPDVSVILAGDISYEGREYNNIVARDMMSSISTLYSTGQQGNIVISTDGTSLQVTSER